MLPGVAVKRDRLDINMVFFTLAYPMELIQRIPDEMLAYGVKVGGWELGEMRWVTNRDVNRADLDHAVKALGKILG